MQLQLKRIGHHDLPMPAQQTAGAVGFDLASAEAVILQPGERALVASGFAWSFPEGFFGHVRPRSGLAVRCGVDVLAGVIDPDYSGEVKVVLVNHGSAPFEVAVGDRIAQMVVELRVEGATVEVAELPQTERGASGFGSTGVRA